MAFMFIKFFPGDMQSVIRRAVAVVDSLRFALWKWNVIVGFPGDIIKGVEFQSSAIIAKHKRVSHKQRVGGVGGIFQLALYNFWKSIAFFLETYTNEAWHVLLYVQVYSIVLFESLVFIPLPIRLCIYNTPLLKRTKSQQAQEKAEDSRYT